MYKSPTAARLRNLHRVLADPLRIRLYEMVLAEPRSVKELATAVGLAPDRLYHHLAQLEEGRLIEIAEYRRLSGGKVERIYGPTQIEPPGDNASPGEVATFLSAVLEATRVDISMASAAKEHGEHREIALGRTVLRLNLEHLLDLRTHIEALLGAAQNSPDDDGVWATVLWTVVDRESRSEAD
ncbi:MAG TPA: winged helix-turn-helix domain-containing protein [Candidatus Dormibacteraeota bacterium]